MRELHYSERNAATAFTSSRACFIVSDADGQALAHIYYEEMPGQQPGAKLLTKDEARKIAMNFARLPELLRAQPHWR